MNLILKKFISFILLISMLAGFVIPVYAAGNEAPEILSVQNSFIQLLVNKDNGGFVIKTVEGSLLRKSDQNKNLLFQGDSFDTSFTTFRINGKDYIFGNHYGFLGLGGEFTIEPGNDSLANVSVWKVGDIEIEQRLEVVNDASDPYIGNVVIKYKATNTGASAADIGARVLLDTMLDANDGAPFELGNGTGTRVDAEKRLTGEEVPDFWKAYDSFTMPAVAAYGFTTGWAGAKKPDEMVMAHWNDLASTKWDYTVNPLVNFATADNTFKTADSAAAMYWNPLSVPAGESVSFETVYGVMNYNAEETDAGFAVNSIAPREIGHDATGGAYEDDGIFEVKLEIDNTLDNAAELNQLTATISLEEGLELASGEESGIYIEKLAANDTQVLTWRVKANAQSEYCVKKYKVDVTRSGFEPLIESGFILLPGISGTPPEIQFNVISPERLYYQGDKYITIKGAGLDKYRDKGYWNLYIQPVNQSDGKIHIPDDNVVLSADFGQLTVIISDDLELGEYKLFFEWTGGFFPSGTVQELPYRVMVTDNEMDRNDQYGILCVVKTQDNKYGLEAYKNEDELDGASLGDSLLLELRGKIYDLSDETSDGSFLIDTSTDPIIINGIVTYSGEMLTLNDETGKITISGNGPIKVIGALTFWKWEWEMVFLDGEDYVLTDTLISGESPVQITLKGLGSILQGVGGFVMDIHYGVFRRLTENDEKFNTISFGGRMAIPLLPGSTNIKNINSSGQNNQNNQTNTNQSGTDVTVMDGIVADVDNVLFGEKKDEDPGFIGIDVTASVGLPENAFGGLIKNSFSASIRINTIQNIYAASFAADLAVLECEGELVLKMHEGMYPIPDTILFSAGGEPGIPVVPGIFYINKLGGGYSDLYNSIFGDSYMLPLTLHLNAGASLFDILSIEAEMELAMTHFSLEGDVTMLKIFPVMEDLSLYVSWVDGFYANARGTIYLYGGCVEGTASMTIANDFFEGWARVMLQVPNYIPVIGGFDLAGVEVGISTVKVWGKVICLGMAFGVVYYWETDNLDFIKGADVPPVTALGTFKTVDGNGNNVIGYLGTNTRLISPVNPGGTLYASSDADKFVSYVPGMFMLAAAITPSDDRRQYTMDLTGLDGAVIQAEYFGEKPGITVSDPNGDAYSLVDGDITGDYQTANMRTQIIPADYAAGISEHKYIIISIPPSSMKGGNWTLTATEPVEVSIIEVESLPELTGAQAMLSANNINVSWTAANADNAVVNVFLCENENDSGIILAKNISAKDGSKVIELPAALSSGTYLVRVALKMGDASYETRFAENSSGGTNFTYVNPNQPQPPSAVAAASSGSGYVHVQVTHPDEANVDGYIVDALDENGNPVATFGAQIFESGEIISIGGWQTSTPVDNSGAAPVELMPVYEGLEPGHNYKVGIRAYREVGEYKCISEQTISGTVFLPVPNPASINIVYGEGFKDSADDMGNPVKLTNLEETKLSFMTNMNVDAVVKVDGNLYESLSGNVFNLSIPIEDGSHLIDFITYNENNDYSCKKIAVTVDATPPDMLIASPLNGSLYTNGKLNIRGTVETGASYNITVDGNTVVMDDSLTGFISAGGILDYTVDITGDKLVHSISISAADKAGNVTSYDCDVFNGDMGILSSVYIRSDDSSDGQVVIKQGETAHLELVGVDASGNEYILNSPQTQWQMLYGGVIASLSTEGGLEGIKPGEAVVLGSYSIANDYAFNDAIPVLVEEDAAANQSPAAVQDLSYNTVVNREIVINLNSIFSDPDNDTMTFTASAGTVTGSIWRYTPSEVKTMSINIYATDSKGASTMAVLSINVLKEPSDQEPSDQEPSDQEPSDQEPSDQEPSDQEPSDQEPSDQEPSDTSDDNGSPTGHSVNYNQTTDVLTVDNMDELIEKAASEGSGTLIINAVDMTSGNLQVVLPVDMINKAKEKGIDNITINTALGNFTFDANSFDTSGAESFKLDFGIADQAALSDAMKETVGNGFVYNIAVTLVMPDNSLKPVTEFDRPVVISLPYNLRPGDNPLQVTAFCLHSDGTLENMAGEYARGSVLFNTNHLSLFLTRYNRVTFKDVPDNAWYIKEVSSLSAKSIINGVSTVLFAPDKNVTRAQFARLIAGILKLKSDDSTSTFSDVPAGAWYAEAVNACAKTGIINGTGAGKFSPDACITRQDMAVMLGRALNYAKGYQPDTSDAALIAFDDRGSISGYATNMVGMVVKYGIINGKPGNVFDPNGAATRAEAAKVIHVLLGLLK